MKMLLKFKSFVDELALDNSRNYKISVLEKYKNDEEIKYLLKFIFDPFIITGISTKKLNKHFEGFEKQLEENFNVVEGESYVLKTLLEYLKIHNTGTDTDIKVVQQFRYLYFQGYEDLFDKIITKDLPIGIDTKTINKVIPGLISEFNVMLANKYFEKPEYVEGKEFALTTKIDGGRIVAIKDNGKVKFYTRSGQEYEGLIDLENELLACPEDNIVFDGEITLLDKGNLTSKEQYKETMKITRKDGEKHGVKMLVFDYMPVSYFINQNCPMPYDARRGVLQVIFSANKFKYFDLLPVLYKGTDTSKITEWLNYNVAHGEEGVMINITTAPYQFKRTSDLLKCKLMQTLDLRVIGFEPGTNKNANRLGALLVRYKDNIVKVGSGFSEELRDEIWQNQDKWINKLVEVQYFEETQNQNGGISLRFPVFVSLRTDKDIADDEA